MEYHNLNIYYNYSTVVCKVYVQFLTENNVQYGNVQRSYQKRRHVVFTDGHHKLVLRRV
jgi:hypothetical protein